MRRDIITMENNNSVLVTGSSKGIGRAIAIEFAKKGFDVAIHYNKDKKGAIETQKEVSKYTKDSIIIKADIGKISQVKMMFEEFFKKYGKIDILINNAAAVIRKPFFKIKEADWDMTLDVNLKSIFFCTQIATKNMVENEIKGSVVNISSVCGFAACECIAPYNAAKGAMNSLTKSIAIELAPHNIRVNGVAPGTTEVERNCKNDPEFSKSWESYIPLGRVAKPEEIAKAVVFMSSNDASYITGHTLCVEGGLLSYIASPDSNFAKKDII